MDALNAEIDRLRLQVHALKGECGAQNISIGNYLLARLEQLGVTVNVFSVKVWKRI
jgi:pyruvate decarboxylase